MLLLEEIKKVFNNMFGDILKEPFHKTLQAYNVMQVFLVLSSQVMLFRIVDSLNTLPDEYKNTAYTSIALLLIGQIFAAVFGIKRQ